MPSQAFRYFELEKKIAQTIHLKNIISLAHWDTATMLDKSSAASCMQGIHWPSGQLGYLPAYANGAIIASMLMQTAQKEYPTMDVTLREGHLNDLNNFLTANLRKPGALKSSSDLLAGATGHAAIQLTIFLAYLKKILVGSRL